MVPLVGLQLSSSTVLQFLFGVLPCTERQRSSLFVCSPCTTRSEHANGGCLSFFFCGFLDGNHLRSPSSSPAVPHAPLFAQSCGMYYLVFGFLVSLFPRVLSLFRELPSALKLPHPSESSLEILYLFPSACFVETSVRPYLLLACSRSGFFPASSYIGFFFIVSGLAHLKFGGFFFETFLRVDELCSFRSLRRFSRLHSR